MVQESYLRWLYDQEHSERIRSYEQFERYYDGDFDLDALLPEKVKNALKQELSISANFCKAIVDAKMEYLCAKPCSLAVSGNPYGVVNDEVEARIGECERDLYHIYNHEYNSLLDENMGKLITICAKKGDVFLKLYHDDTIPVDQAWGILDQIQIRVLDPQYVFPKYREDDYQRLEYVIIKTPYLDEDGAPYMKAQVFYPDRVEFYDEVSENNTQYTTWELVDTQDNPDGFIPIQHIKNGVSDLQYGVSDIRDIIELQNGINKTITDLFVSMDYTAFQRLVISGALAEKGQKINMSPGGIIQLLDPESKVTTIEPGDVTAFLQPLDKFIDILHKISKVPKIAFGGAEGGVPSGYALRVQYMPLELKCSPLREIIKNQFNVLNAKILKMLRRLGYADYTDLEAKLEFNDGLPVDDTAVTDDTIKLKEARLISTSNAMKRVGVEDTEEEQELIDQESFQEESFGIGRVATEAGVVAQALQGATITAEAQPANVPPSQMPK